MAEEEAVRIAYAAPSSCPDEQVFVGRVRARTQHGRFADPEELARTFDVSLTEAARGQGFSGKIAFTDADGSQAERKVSGATCDEVSSSLALIMALSIDDRVALSAARDNAPSPSPSPVAPSAPPKKNNPTPAVAPPAPTLGSPATPLHLRWEVGASVGALSWLTPDPEPFFGAYVELAARARSWSARLSAFDTRESKQVRVGEGAHFATDWVRLEGCPLRASLSSHLGLAPCVAFDLGILRASAEGSALTPHAPDSRFWGAGVALLRLSGVIQERLVVSLDGELGVPFVHQQFVIGNAGAAPTRAFGIPSLGLGAKAGVGLRFP